MVFIFFSQSISSEIQGMTSKLLPFSHQHPLRAKIASPSRYSYLSLSFVCTAPVRRLRASHFVQESPASQLSSSSAVRLKVTFRQAMRRTRAAPARYNKVPARLTFTRATTACAEFSRSSLQFTACSALPVNVSMTGVSHAYISWIHRCGTSIL